MRGERSGLLRWERRGLRGGMRGGLRGGSGGGQRRRRGEKSYEKTTHEILRICDIFAYLEISSSDHSRHSSQRALISQSKPRHCTQIVWRSADFLLILLGQDEHLRRPSDGVSTEDSDEEGGAGGTGGKNPGSSNE